MRLFRRKPLATYDDKRDCWTVPIVLNTESLRMLQGGVVGIIRLAQVGDELTFTIEPLRPERLP